MFEGLFQPMHLVVIFVIALLVFGPRRLPELGKGLGEAILGFKNSFSAGEATLPPPATRGESALGSSPASESAGFPRRAPSRPEGV